MTEREIVSHLVARHGPAAIVLVGSRADDAARARRRAARRRPRAASHSRRAHRGAVRPEPAAGARAARRRGPQRRVTRAAHLSLVRRWPQALARRAGAPEHELARNLARMRARADQPGAFFEAVTFVFYLAHRAWYEVLHDRWSVSVHRALPEIARADPRFHECLVTLMDAREPAARIAAAETIFARLFR